jgi:hypothetical protein
VNCFDLPNGTISTSPVNWSLFRYLETELLRILSSLEMAEMDMRFGCLPSRYSLILRSFSAYSSITIQVNREVKIVFAVTGCHARALIG